MFQQLSSDPLKNYKATKPAFNLPASETPFQWRADDMAHLLRYLDPLSPHQLKNYFFFIKFGPPLTKLSGSAHAISPINPYHAEPGISWIKINWRCKIPNCFPQFIGSLKINWKKIEDNLAFDLVLSSVQWISL